jgi:hypothetical protein
MASMLRPFYRYQKEIDLMIDKEKNPSTIIPQQPISNKPYERERNAGLSTGAIIVVLAILIFLLILIASS